MALLTVLEERGYLAGRGVIWLEKGQTVGDQPGKGNLGVLLRSHRVRSVKKAYRDPLLIGFRRSVREEGEGSVSLKRLCWRGVDTLGFAMD